MTLSKTFALLFLTTHHSISASNSTGFYSITSKKFYTGESSKICLQITNLSPGTGITTDFSLNELSNWNSGKDELYTSELLNELDTVNLDSKNCYDVTIPANVDSSKSFEMVMAIGVIDKNSDDNGLRLTARNGVNIANSDPVVFLSTDKPVYKPGQTVKFRVSALDRFLKPINSEKLSITEVFLKNPSGSKLVSETTASFNDYGMWGDEYMVVYEAETGDWEFGVKVLEDSESGDRVPKEISTTFKVTEYVLPKYDVEITPEFTENAWYYLSDSFNFKVCSKYTHGAKVTGTSFVELIWSANEWFWPESEKEEDMLVNSEKELDDQGCANFELKLAAEYTDSEKLKMINKMRKISVNVEVEELGTGETMSDTLEMLVTTKPKLINFYDKVLKKSMFPEKIVRNMSYPVSFRLTNWDGTDSAGTNDLYVHVSTNWNFNEEDVTSKIYLYSTSAGILDIDLKNMLGDSSHKQKRVYVSVFSEKPVSEKNYLQDETLTGMFDAFSQSWDNKYSRYVESLELMKSQVEIIGGDENILQVFGTKLDCANKTVQSEIYVSIESEETVDLKVKLVSQGSVVSEENNPAGIQLKTISESGMYSIQFELPFDQIPIGLELLYFIVLSDSGVISGSVSLTDDSVGCLVNLDISLPEVAKPGENIEVVINGVNSGTECSLSIVDDSVEIYAKNNGLENNDLDLDYIVKAGIDPFKPSWGYSSNCRTVHRRERSVMPWGFYGEPESFRIFSSFNDVDCSDDYPVYMMEADGGPVMLDFAQGMKEDSDENLKIDDDSSPSAESDTSSPIKVRNFMPETWLWTLQNTENSASSKLKISTKTPDTMTSWTANAYCLSKINRISLSKPVKMTVTKKLFVEIKLPYSCVRREKLTVPVQVFNNDEVEHVVNLKMKTEIDGNTEYFSIINESSRSGLKIKPGEQTIEFFEVLAVGIGETKLTVIATSETESDGMEQTVIIEPEGVGKEITNSNLLCLEGETETFQLPARPRMNVFSMVEDSLRNRITIVDDLMGSAMENLDKLIKVPYGCGEQNMVSVVPNIAVANYLSDENPHKAQAIKNAKYGYQRQLNYQRRDGSFSAFGESDKEGSSWLTSFVLRSFADASVFVQVDTEKMLPAIDYLINSQMRNGAFPITGQVLHNDLFDEKKAGDAAKVYMTVSAVLALVKVRQSWDVGSVNRIESSISNGVSFLDSNSGRFEDFDSYILSQIFYLAQTGNFNDLIEKSWTILESREISENGWNYWQAENSNENTVVEETSRWWYEPPSADVETTGYVFLGMLAQNIELGGREYNIMKYLQAQRNEFGGWSSTQNTMLALSALGEYASRMNPGESDLKIKISDLEEVNIVEKQFKTVTMIDVNEIDDIVPEIWNIEVSGTGCVLIQSTIKYNIYNNSSPENLLISYEPKTIEILRKRRDTSTSQRAPILFLAPKTTSKYNIEAGEFCVKSKSGVTNMGILEIKLVTGYSLKTDISVPKNLHAELKRVEVDNDKIEFYFDKFGEVKRCLVLEFFKEIDVEGVAPASAKAYDYYSPEKASGVLMYGVSKRASSNGEFFGSKGKRHLMPRYAPFIFGAIGLLLG